MLTTAAEDRRAAESFALDYVTALINRDLSALTERASVPFYLENQVVLSPEALRSQYDETYRSQPGDKKKDTPRILSVETRSIAEWKAEGKFQDYDTRQDPLLKSIRLAEADYMVLIRTPGHALAVYTRRVGPKLTIAGWQSS